MVIGLNQKHYEIKELNVTLGWNMEFNSLEKK